MSELPLAPCQLNSKCNADRCDDTDHQHPDDWFEDPGSGKDTPEGRRRRKAIQACWWDCPMQRRLLCLDKGLESPNLSHGVWGGYTEAQRQEIHAGIEKRRTARARAAS